MCGNIFSGKSIIFPINYPLKELHYCKWVAWAWARTGQTKNGSKCGRLERCLKPDGSMPRPLRFILKATKTVFIVSSSTSKMFCVYHRMRKANHFDVIGTRFLQDPGIARLEYGMRVLMSVSKYSAFRKTAHHLASMNQGRIRQIVKITQRYPSFLLELS